MHGPLNVTLDSLSFKVNSPLADEQTAVCWKVSMLPQLAKSRT